MQIFIDKNNIDEVLSKIEIEETAPKFLIVDLFCGAGGTTTGFELAGGIAKVIACVNHDPIAIKSHWTNHPHVLHFEEDIRTLDLEPLQKIVEHYRILYPDALVILWGSLECTNFSKAKGGQPRDADSRTLADHLPRYITAIDPDYVQIENVVEFMGWGPLDKNGKPVSSKNGSEWLRWRREIKAMGYYDDWTTLNSADFGAYTSRNRLFGCFAKEGLPIVWPQPTHAKKVHGGMFGSLQPWMPVKHVLDFSDQGESIFNRSDRGKKELVEATLKRIYAGLVKHVAGGEDKFILKYNSMSQNGSHVPPSVNEPCPVIPCQNRLGLAFISKYFSGAPESKNITVEGPAGTIRCRDGQALVQAFLMNYNHSSKSNSILSPSPTLVTKDKLAIINPGFIMKYYSSGGQTSSINDPSGSITTKDRMAKVWLDKQYGGPENHQSVNQPSGAIMQNDKHCMMHAPFILNTNFNNTANSVDNPMATLTASRHHPYIVNPSHGGHTTSTDNPCPVIIARQDKAPLSIIQTVSGHGIPIYEGDSETMIKIKTFMAVYGIGDIKLRKLKLRRASHEQKSKHISPIGPCWYHVWERQQSV